MFDWLYDLLGITKVWKLEKWEDGTTQKYSITVRLYRPTYDQVMNASQMVGRWADEGWEVTRRP
jgi:hypothetical protein